MPSSFLYDLWRTLFPAYLTTMPGEEEMDYLPTQVIAEFLAVPDGLNIDGIRHPSVQAGHQGNNIIFFHEHGNVRFVHRLKTLRVVWPFELEDTLDVIAREAGSQKDREQPEEVHECELFDNECQDPSLQLDTNSIKLCYIKSVTTNYSSQEGMWEADSEVALSRKVCH